MSETIEAAQAFTAALLAMAPDIGAALWLRLASPAGCTVVIAGVLVLAIICRFAKMTRDTSNSVALQYLIKLAGALGSVGLYLLPGITLGYEDVAEWVLVPCLAAGFANMLISARRWRYGAPIGVQRARPYWHATSEPSHTWM